VEWLEKLPVYPYLLEMLNIDYERISDVIHFFSDGLSSFLTLREQEVSADTKAVMRALKRQAVQQELQEVKQRLQEFQDGLTEEERNDLLRRKEKLAKEFYHL